MSNPSDLPAYRAAISVTFAGAEPFVGTVYVQGDGNHAVFQWPTQANTRETTELAEFRTRTKWVTSGGVCRKSAFTDPDPNFVGMVSHADYHLISADDRRRVYRSEPIVCTYGLDADGREVIESIDFPGAKIAFSQVVLGAQDPALFIPPRDCEAQA